jgi:signal transduction histidine kinase
MCVLVALFGYVTAQLEGIFFESELRRHELIVGRALGLTLAEAWRVSGEARALELIDVADRDEPDLRIRWVWYDAPPGDRFHPGPEERRGERAVERRDITSVPVLVPGERRGGLEISESLEPEDRHVRSILLRTAVTAVALALLCSGLAAALGRIVVGRRVESLATKARRIGAGDLSDPLLLGGDDELVDLARELNATCVALAGARTELLAETAARIATLDQLRHADRLNTVGKLASGIAHELGTPMTVVRGRAMMIAAGEVSGAEARENAGIMAEQIDRMSGIIRQLLDFARRRRAEKAPADLQSVAQQTLHLLEPLAHKRRVTLALGARTQEGPIAMNVGQIQQALTNLVMNAVHASAPGGTVEVTIARKAATPPASHGGPPGDFLALSVQDQGVGIAPEHLPHVFEPFFTTREVGEGTGLGLSVTFGIVQDHGGWIEIESALRSGSRFTIYLPAE